MQVRQVSSRPNSADSGMSKLEAMPEFFEAEAQQAMSEVSGSQGGSRPSSRPGSAELQVSAKDWNRGKWAGAAASAAYMQDHQMLTTEHHDPAGMPRPLPMVDRVSPTLGGWTQHARDEALTTRSRVEGVRSVASSDIWYTLDVQCANLPANSADAEFKIGAKDLPPLSIEADIALQCASLPSLDEEKYELQLSSHGLPMMDDGRYCIELEASSLPPVADPRFELYFRSSELRPAPDAERRDIMLVIKTVPEDPEAHVVDPRDRKNPVPRPVEIGRTDVAVPPLNRRDPVAFEDSIMVTWTAETEKMQVDAYFTSKEVADAKNGSSLATSSRTLDLILDCELAASHIFKVKRLADSESGIEKLRMVRFSTDFRLIFRLTLQLTLVHFDAPRRRWRGAQRLRDLNLDLVSVTQR